MIERLIGQFPAWMRSRNPVLRYSLGNHDPDEKPKSPLRNTLAFAALVVLFILSGYLIANAVSDERPLDMPLSKMLFEVLFWPTFALQIVLQVVVMALTINTVGQEKRRQTWDSLKATSLGAAMALRARWSAVVFYRIRPLMVILVLVRLALFIGILVDLTAFRGEYLNYLTGNITPDIPLAGGILLLALTMTASLLLPFTGLGFDASIGLYISTFVEQRTYVLLSQFLLTIARLVVIGALLMGATQFREGALPIGTTDLGTWLLLFGFAVIGDWGLSLLYLGFYGSVVWADVPYGILIGVAMLVFVIFQAAISDGVMALAIRRAERSE